MQQNLKVSFQNTNKSEKDYPTEQLQVNVVINDLPTQFGKIKNAETALFVDGPVFRTSLPNPQKHRLLQ
jgi:hypothetical protein